MDKFLESKISYVENLIENINYIIKITNESMVKNNTTRRMIENRFNAIDHGIKLAEQELRVIKAIL